MIILDAFVWIYMDWTDFVGCMCSLTQFFVFLGPILVCFHSGQIRASSAASCQGHHISDLSRKADMAKLSVKHSGSNLNFVLPLWLPTYSIW